MTRYIVTSIAILVLAAWLVTNRTGAQQATDNASEAKIQELLKLRHDVLRERYEVVRKRHEDGTLSAEHVVPALDDLLKARLELAASRKERIDICKQRVDNLRSLEAIAEARVKTGTGPIEDQMLATAARLQAEIDCLREER